MFTANGRVICDAFFSIKEETFDLSTQRLVLCNYESNSTEIFMTILFAQKSQ